MIKYVLIPLRKTERLDMRTGDYLFKPYDYLICKCTVVGVKQQLFHGENKTVFEIILDGKTNIQFAEKVFDTIEEAEEEKRKIL